MTIMMHKGSRSVSYEELKEVSVPERTRTHWPIPHHEIIDAAQDTLGKLQAYDFSDHKFLVSNDGQKFLGSMTVKSLLWDKLEDYDFKIGIMSSHDKTHPVVFFAGTNVFICTNGQWSSDIRLSRKHTPNAWDDIYANLRNLTFEMDNIRKDTVQGFESLKDIDFDSQREVHDFVVQSCERGITPWQHAPRVLEHWNEPEHHEFKDRNGYSLFNAYTSNWRSGNPFDLSSKTTRLRKFIDEFKNIRTVEPRHQSVGDLPQGLGESRL